MSELDKYSSSSTSYAIGVLFALLCVIIYIIIKNNQHITSNIYVVNTYMYILLAVIICSLTILFMDYFHFDGFNVFTIIITFVLLITIIFALALTDRSNILARHIMWLIFAIGVGVLLYPTYLFDIDRGILLSVLITLVVLIISLTLMAYYAPLHYFDGWGPILLLSLLGLIIFELADISISFFSGTSITADRVRIYSIIGIIIFSGFIMYDTQRLRIDADDVLKCISQNSNDSNLVNVNLICADYPYKSLNIFLDIINLFNSLSYSTY